MNRGSNRYLRTLLWGCAFVALMGLLGYGPPAVAQEQEELTPEQQAAMEQALQKTFEEEIVVTGSLIPRPTLESMSPVSVLEPEEILYSGVTRMEDLVKQLPQVFSPQNSTVSNGASGTATVDLRNMGDNRTLVLINGRRTVTGDAFQTAADLNFIPAALVKRVDVLTGGASSVYGADAVTGVVNFVLDTDFEGIKGGISWNGYQHDNSNSVAAGMNAARGFDYPIGNTLDGEQYNINLAIGGKFGGDKGHASMYLDFRNADGLTKSERDYTNCSIARGANGPVCGGSGTIPQGRFLVYDPNWDFVGDYVLNQQTGDLQPRAGEVYNFGPLNYMQRPDKKWAGGGFINYKFNEHVDVYAEVMFMDDYTEAQIAQSGDFGNTEQLNCDNPMMSPQQRELLCGPDVVYIDDFGIPRTNTLVLRRSVETGPRTSIIRHTSWRLVGGVRGDINDAWSYDLYGLYAEMSSPQEYVGDLSVSRMVDALDVIGDPDDPTTWRCRSGNDGCVPWNIFTPGGVTPEAASYIMLNMNMSSGAKTEMLNGTLTGDLEEYGVKLPTATEGIQVALGAEYRQESLYVHTDDNWANGNGAGQGGPTVRVDGNYNVAEMFFEALLPVVQDATGFKDLSFELGYRYSDYSTSGTADTWKVQGTWAPADLIKFRLGLARASRAANVQELFRPQGIVLGGSEDPCANDPTTGVPSLSLEQCLRTGMTESQYGNVLANPAGQYNALAGGNPDLTVEVADTFTAGVVLTPPSINGFSLAIDYYDIQIDDVITSFNADDVITGCATTGDPGLCALINRDVAGTLWLTPNGYTVTTNQNLGTLYGEGVDLNYNWLIDIGNAGFLNTSLMGTYMLANRLETPLIDYDCVGYYGNQCAPYPTPEWRHRARISWETNFDMVFSLGWRYIDEVTNDDASPDPDLANPGLIESWIINDALTIDAYNYFDLAWTWNLGENYQFVLGCNNIFDEEPPLGPDNTWNDYAPGFYSFYDAYGRTLFASIHFDF